MVGTRLKEMMKGRKKEKEKEGAAVLLENTCEPNNMRGNFYCNTNTPTQTQTFSIDYNTTNTSLSIGWFVLSEQYIQSIMVTKEVAIVEVK